MAFQKNNEFWKLRTKVGRERMFADPEALREACNEYFKSVAENPLFDEKVGFSEGAAIYAPIPKPRAMSLSSLCLFIGIPLKTYYDWKNTRADLLPVLVEAEQVIWGQKFEAAAAGLLNANIISRELGLADKTETTVTIPTIVLQPPPGAEPPDPPIFGE